ncbi:MAG: hypothetical protein M1834_008250 [Cirrosporium novae-zelandiae]|nr:MAG: hypothetical protein M1834_008250 [Cirrosporium novae-zelandiae]
MRFSTATTIMAAAPVLASASTTFTLMSARSGSAIHLQSVQASDQALWIGGETETYCPNTTAAIDCTQFDNVAAFTFNEGAVAMDVSVPGGQLLYVKSDGEIGYTPAHSAGDIVGADTTSWTYTAPTNGNSFGTLSTTAFNSTGFIACEHPAENRYKIFAYVPSVNITTCLGFDALAVTRNSTDAAAWSYE